MNTNFKKGIEEIKNSGMNAQEKQAILERVIATPRAIPTRDSIKSPIINTGKIPWYFSPRPLVAAFLLLIILGGTGLVSASQNSLPGNVLYSVKINFREPLIDALAPGPEVLAELQAEKATRRMKEAEILASKNKLDEKSEEQIKKLLDKHTNTLTDALDKVRKEKKPKKSADAISDSFQTEMNDRASTLDLMNIKNKKVDKKEGISETARKNAKKVEEDKANKGSKGKVDSKKGKGN